MVKYERLAEILRQRLAAGDYALRPFPAERDLAAELGASYLTARKAVLQLLAEGLLVRCGRGRAVPAGGCGSARPTLALLAHGWPTRGLLRLERAFAAAAAAVGLPCRSQRFFHWDDPVLVETLSRSAGTLLLPPAEDPTPGAAALLHESRTRVVVVGPDFGPLGLHGIDHLPPAGVRLGLDHLVALGHRRLLVANVQPHCHDMRARLAEVQAWVRAHPGLEVAVADRPVVSGTDTVPAARALARALLAGPGRASAALGLTLPMAMGLLRGAADLGIHGLAVVAIDGEDLADELVPALSAVEIGGLEEALAMAAGWMAGGAWSGPARLRCPPRLAVRETSSPP